VSQDPQPLTKAQEAAASIALMEMRDWVDAYEVILECNMMAATDPRKHQEIADAEAAIKADLVIATSDEQREQLRAALAEQQQVARVMKSFSAESFFAVRATWRLVREDLLTVGWDLRRDVDFQGKPNGELWGRQGGGPFKKWPQEKGLVVATFMHWVMQTQNDVKDPVAYTKAMLERQGITKENFHEHADKLAIRNPWGGDSLIITDRS
jgi:hypothetical protein